MSITIEPYSEWSIVVRGDTKSFKKHLADLGGTWNTKLTKGGPGWIFKKKDKEGVEKLRSDIDSGKISPSDDNEESEISDRSSSRPAAASSSSSSSGDWVPMKTYLALLARVERLESICSHSPFVDSSSKKAVKSGPKEIEFEDDAEDADVAEEENDKAVTGLLRKKKVVKKVVKKAKE
ncbi:MAG: hypothetical protein PHG66_00570 [Candidatus Colwellbacteria bacterium]|nr:hypothetical protein [Candidatus Colwellbacteria bacterium]